MNKLYTLSFLALNLITVLHAMETNTEKYAFSEDELEYVLYLSREKGKHFSESNSLSDENEKLKKECEELHAVLCAKIQSSLQRLATAQQNLNTSAYCESSKNKINAVIDRTTKYSNAIIQLLQQKKRLDTKKLQGYLSEPLELEIILKTIDTTDENSLLNTLTKEGFINPDDNNASSESPAKEEI